MFFFVYCDVFIYSIYNDIIRALVSFKVVINIINKYIGYMIHYRLRTPISTKQTQLCTESENSPTTADDR